MAVHSRWLGKYVLCTEYYVRSTLCSCAQSRLDGNLQDVRLVCIEEAVKMPAEIDRRNENQMKDWWLYLVLCRNNRRRTMALTVTPLLCSLTCSFLIAWPHPRPGNLRDHLGPAVASCVEKFVYFRANHNLTWPEFRDQHHPEWSGENNHHHHRPPLHTSW